MGKKWQRFVTALSATAKEIFLSKHFILSNSKPLLCLPFLFETLPLSFCFEIGPHFLLFLIILSCLPALAIFSPWCLNHWNICGKLHFLFLLPFKPHLLFFFRKSATYLLLFLILLQVLHVQALWISDRLFLLPFLEKCLHFLQSLWLLFAPYPSVQWKHN